VDLSEAIAGAMDDDGTDDSPTDGGQVVEGQGETGGEDDRYFDPSQYSDRLVKVTINGQEQDVPVADLVNGYSRQSDYTQKTQALAAERQQLAEAEALWSALQSNPNDTLEYLASQYGLGGDADGGEYDEDGYDQFGNFDPRLDEAYAALDARLAPFEQWQAEQTLRQTLNGLGEQYGADFNPKEVLEVALQQDRVDLENVAKEVMFDKIFARMQGQKQAEAAGVAETQQRQAAAAQAGVVSSGGSAAGVADASAAPPHNLSIAEAMDLAVQQHGEPTSWTW